MHLGWACYGYSSWSTNRYHILSNHSPMKTYQKTERSSYQVVYCIYSSPDIHRNDTCLAQSDQCVLMLVLFIICWASRVLPTQKFYVPFGHTQHEFMCLFRILCAQFLLIFTSMSQYSKIFQIYSTVTQSCYTIQL